MCDGDGAQGGQPQGVGKRDGRHECKRHGHTRTKSERGGTCGSKQDEPDEVRPAEDDLRGGRPAEQKAPGNKRPQAYEDDHDRNRDGEKRAAPAQRQRDAHEDNGLDG